MLVSWGLNPLEFAALNGYILTIHIIKLFAIHSHIANKYLKPVTSAHAVAQDVEWLYAYDVHCNAYICSFGVTYVLQYLLLPILLSKTVLSCIMANTLYAIAVVWYAYITHLGYKGKNILSVIVASLDYVYLRCGHSLYTPPFSPSIPLQYPGVLLVHSAHHCIPLGLPGSNYGVGTAVQLLSDYHEISLWKLMIKGKKGKATDETFTEGCYMFMGISRWSFLHFAYDYDNLFSFFHFERCKRGSNMHAYIL